jgi:hypothetical protein
VKWVKKKIKKNDAFFFQLSKNGFKFEHILPSLLVCLGPKSGFVSDASNDETANLGNVRCSRRCRRRRRR